LRLFLPLYFTIKIPSGPLEASGFSLYSLFLLLQRGIPLFVRCQCQRTGVGFLVHWPL
jgi:hypothetical protein